MQRLFKGKGTKRPAGADYALSYTDPSEAYMSLPHVVRPTSTPTHAMRLTDCVCSPFLLTITRPCCPSWTFSPSSTTKSRKFLVHHRYQMLVTV